MIVNLKHTKFMPNTKKELNSTKISKSYLKVKTFFEVKSKYYNSILIIKNCLLN